MERAGGISNRGTLTLTSSAVLDNIANCQAGGIRNEGERDRDYQGQPIAGNEADDGAGLSNLGTATVTGTTFEANARLLRSLGGAILNDRDAHA